MKRTLTLFVFVIVFLVVSSVLAQQGFWEKKEWQKWSPEECKKMLEDSPWARRWAQSVPQMAEFSTLDHSTGLGSNNGGTGSEAKLEIYYIVQLRSAQPIREAMMRQQEIQMKYDSLNEKQRAGVDQQVNGVINRAYDNIVVHVLYGTNVQQYEHRLANYWQSIPTGTVPVTMQAFLDLSDGKKVSPLSLQSPRNGQNEFELSFPRVVDGEPVVTADSKILGIEFQTPTIGNVPGDRLHIEFKPDKMKVNGAVQF